LLSSHLGRNLDSLENHFQVYLPAHVACDISVFPDFHARTLHFAHGKSVANGRNISFLARKFHPIDKKLAKPQV